MKKIKKKFFSKNFDQSSETLIDVLNKKKKEFSQQKKNTPSQLRAKKSHLNKLFVSKKFQDELLQKGFTSKKSSSSSSSRGIASHFLKLKKTNQQLSKQRVQAPESFSSPQSSTTKTRHLKILEFLAPLEKLPQGDQNEGLNAQEDLPGVRHEDSQSQQVSVSEETLDSSLPLLTSMGDDPHTPKFLPLQELLSPSHRFKLAIEGFLLNLRSKHTRVAYQKDLKRFVKYLMGRSYSQKMDQGAQKAFQPGFDPAAQWINRSLMIQYKDYLASQKLQATTIDRHLATLRSFFDWLIEEGVVEKNPLHGVRFLNPRRVSKTLGFSDEEVKKMLSAPDLHTRIGAFHYAVLMVLFYCGLRRSELCELNFQNLGKERGQNVLRLIGKGNAERLIVLIPAVWNAIHYYIFINRRKLLGGDPLFSSVRRSLFQKDSSQRLKRLHPNTIFFIVQKYAKKSGILARVSPHSCRATAISNARDHHVPDRAIQEFAGWSTPDMITRYDKRKSSIENSAAFSIYYGALDRSEFMPDLKSDQKDPAVNSSSNDLTAGSESELSKSSPEQDFR